MIEHKEKLLYLIPIILGMILVVISLIVKNSNESYKAINTKTTKVTRKNKPTKTSSSNIVLDKKVNTQVDTQVDTQVNTIVDTVDTSSIFFTKTDNKMYDKSELELLSNATTQVLQVMTYNNMKLLPDIVKTVESILGEKKFRAFSTGSPYMIDITSYLPKNSADVPSSYYIKLVRDVVVPDGYYMTIKSDKIDKLDNLTSHDGIYFLDKIKDEMLNINTFLIMLKMLSEYNYLNKINLSRTLSTSSGFIQVVGAGLGNLVFPPNLQPVVPNLPRIPEEDRWLKCLPFGVARNNSSYMGQWDKVVILNDSEVEALGNDFYGILSIGNIATGGFTSKYIMAGQDDRSKLINIGQSDNLNFGRSSLATFSYTTRNCLSKYNREYGQGTKIGILEGRLVTLYPFICNDTATKLDIRFGLDITQPRANFRIIVKDGLGNVLNNDGKISGTCNWITYDKCSNMLVTPNDSDCSYVNLYNVELSSNSLILTFARTAILTESGSSSPQTYSMSAACICEDGNLYAVINQLVSQGVVVMRQTTQLGERGSITWKFEQFDFISMDVDDKLVGITEVDDIRLAKTYNVPTLVVAEINEDYFSQDNITLHELIPTDAILKKRGPFGTSSESGNIRDLLDELACGGGVAIYNLQRAQNEYFITRDAPLTLNDPALIGFKNYLISRGINQDIDLDRVMIYDNQCLAANYWKYSEGQSHTVSGMCFGYTIYLRDRVIQSNGKIRGRILKVLTHELAHTRQFVQLGESMYQFGCVYGEGVIYAMLEHGGNTYSFNPIEVEARNFSDRHMIRNVATAQRWGINIDTSRTSFEYDAGSFPRSCGPQP